MDGVHGLDNGDSRLELAATAMELAIECDICREL